MELRPDERSHRTQRATLARLSLRALTVVHPAPSALNAALVATLALIAGGGGSVAGVLAIGMLGFQFSIGALNDVVDVEADRLRQPRKPIPAGLVTKGAAGTVVGLGACVGFGISASFGLEVLLLGVAGYTSGVAYDVVMRRAGLGWLCFAAAIPLMLAWTWFAAAGTLPPAWPFLLPLAALAGPALHLANSLVDVELDAPADRASLATRLGPHRAKIALTILMATVLALAWATLASVGSTSTLALAGAAVATASTALGVALSWQDARPAREAGWLFQAVGLAAMAAAWLASMA